MTAGLVQLFAQLQEGPGRGPSLESGPSALLIAAIVLGVLLLATAVALFLTRRRRAKSKRLR